MFSRHYLLLFQSLITTTRWTYPLIPNNHYIRIKSVNWVIALLGQDKQNISWPIHTGLSQAEKGPFNKSCFPTDEYQVQEVLPADFPSHAFPFQVRAAQIKVSSLSLSQVLICTDICIYTGFSRQNLQTQTVCIK